MPASTAIFSHKTGGSFTKIIVKKEDAKVCRLLVLLIVFERLSSDQLVFD